MKRSDQQKAIARRRKQKQVKSQLTWGIVSGAVIIGGALFIWRFARPAIGVSHEIEGSNHVSEGQPIVYVSNPPTSGEHYEVPMPAGFYEEDSEETQLPYPEGYLVHNLEHGYTVFWYNCAIISEVECISLKSQIREVMDDFNGIKLIAFPWDLLDKPVVMTSWGQMQEFEEFDLEVAKEFIKTNRLKAPEPNAP